jgi:protein-S-isoprenylcysteine O-methyltransferase Ste14
MGQPNFLDTGATNGPAGRGLTMAQSLENRLPPPLVAVVLALVMGVIAWTTPATPMPTVVRVGGAALFLLFAGLMGGRAFRAFARAGTTISPVDIEAASHLVTTGIYGVSRNPMYVALTSLLLAVAVGLSNGWALAGPILFALFTTRFQIVPEERVMRAKFGEAYAAYTARVRRWL